MARTPRRSLGKDKKKGIVDSLFFFPCFSDALLCAFYLGSSLSFPARDRVTIVSLRERGSWNTKRRSRRDGTRRRELRSAATTTTTPKEEEPKQGGDGKKAHPFFISFCFSLSLSPLPILSEFSLSKKKKQAPPGRARPLPLGHARRRRRAGPGGENDVSLDERRITLSERERETSVFFPPPPDRRSPPSLFL